MIVVADRVDLSMCGILKIYTINLRKPVFKIFFLLDILYQNCNWVIGTYFETYYSRESKTCNQKYYIKRW